MGVNLCIFNLLCSQCLAYFFAKCMRGLSVGMFTYTDHFSMPVEVMVCGLNLHEYCYKLHLQILPNQKWDVDVCLKTKKEKKNL